MFKKYTDKIIEEQIDNFETSKLLELEAAFMNFSIKTYPGNIDYVNQILDSCGQILKSSTLVNKDGEIAMKMLARLLIIPLDKLSMQVLKMDHYPTIMSYMKFSDKCVVALRICKAVIKDRKPISSARSVDQLILLIKPLLADDEHGHREQP